MQLFTKPWIINTPVTSWLSLISTKSPKITNAAITTDKIIGTIIVV